jgi:GR25 family glycosyltransferase involved in LPS biosynthesis
MTRKDDVAPMFSRSYVINLPFKMDRLAKFQSTAPRCLGQIDAWRAVHGDTVQHPDWWTAGRGAWGCYKSHFQILEKCYNEGVESYLVFEDDAVFRNGFDGELTAFMESVPQDWEMIYLGGQLLHEVANPPKRVNEHCFVPYNVNRTHAFAVHKRGYDKLYQHLSATPFAAHEHIDHHLGRLHESGRLKVYCPGKWLVGQDAGPSNISGNLNGISFWVDPERLAQPNWMSEPPKCVFLEAPLDIAIDLRLKGWHQGHWRNEHQLDRGVAAAVNSRDVAAGLAKWFRFVQSECIREGHKCVCLYHPSLTWDFVSTLGWAEFERISAASVAEAESAFAAMHNPPEQESASPQRRNLCYHIWPRHGEWQWSVEQLLKRIEQFNGVRSIGVVTDDESDSLADVQAAFAGHRIDHWVTFPNDHELGQSVTFAPLLETVSCDGGVTFYGHSTLVPLNTEVDVKRLAELLYEANLDANERVVDCLEKYPIAKVVKHFPMLQGAPKNALSVFGSFFWFRNVDVFGREGWSEVVPINDGVNDWLSRLFTIDQCGALPVGEFKEGLPVVCVGGDLAVVS